MDKRVSPFVSLDRNRLLDPCLRGCVSTYSYRHHVDLTDDADAFDVSPIATCTVVAVRVEVPN